MQVGPRGVARAAHLADALAGLDQVADLHVYSAQVFVTSLESVAVTHVTRLPYVPAGPAWITVPCTAATTGVPAAAARSKPACVICVPWDRIGPQSISRGRSPTDR